MCLACDTVDVDVAETTGEPTALRPGADRAQVAISRQVDVELESTTSSTAAQLTR